MKLYARLAITAVAPMVMAAEEPPLLLVLDCPVTRASSVFDLVNSPIAVAIVRAERYRFTLSSEGGAGLASTIRNANIQADVVASDAEFQITFENKQVVIDRITAEFVLSFQNAKSPIGGGVCTKLEDKKF